MSSPPLKPTDAQHQGAHNATPYQASVEQQPSHEAFWVRTFNDPIAAFTLVLAATTICLLIANVFLWLTTRSAVRLGRDVMGWIEYLDERGIRRRTAFCREYIQRDGSCRFYPVDDPDYEHEE